MLELDIRKLGSVQTSLAVCFLTTRYFSFFRDVRMNQLKMNF